MVKRVVITGSKGFIGSALFSALNNNLCDTMFTLIDKAYSNNKAFNIRWSNLKRQFKNVDTVFHLAALTSLPECQANPKLAYDVNVGGTVNVLEAARLNDVRKVIFASSSAVYEGTKLFPSREHMKVNPILVYPSTKVAAEEACMSYAKTYDLDVTILRYSNVYGAGANTTRQSPPFFIYVIKELLNNRRPQLYSNGMQSRDYVYIDDVVDATIIAANHKNLKGEIFNITNEEVLSVNEIYDQIAKILDSNLKPVYNYPTKIWEGYKNLYKGRQIKNDVIINEVNKYCSSCAAKAFGMLQWRAKYSFEDGIKETIKKYKEIYL